MTSHDMTIVGVLFHYHSTWTRASYRLKDILPRVVFQDSDASRVRSDDYIVWGGLEVRVK